MVQAPITIGMAEVKVTVESEPLVCLGLGSCIGLIAYDPIAGISGMAHIMLPTPFPNKPVVQPGKFAETAVPHLIDQAVQLGARRAHLVFAYAGGAQVFNLGVQTRTLDVGIRNAEATAQVLRSLSMRVLAFDVGGTCGRTVTFDPSSGEVRVRSIRGGEHLLCNLRTKKRSA